MKRLLLLFLVSLFDIVSWGQGQTIPPQPKPTETNLTKIEPQISTRSNGAMTVQPPKNYALLVGISDYEYIHDLLYADKDARDVAQFLREQFGKNIEIDTLLNKQANLEAILRAFNKKSNVPIGGLNGSKIYILLSGHGGIKEYGYFYPAEYDNNIDDLAGEKVINMNFVWGHINSYVNIGGAMVVLLIDACHAGGFDPDKFKKIISSWPKNDKSAAFLATVESQEAIEPSSVGNGLLVYHFIRGATDELQKDGVVQVFEMKNHLTKEVPATALKNGHQQNPVVVGDSALVILESSTKMETITKKKDEESPVQLPFKNSSTPANTITPKESLPIPVPSQDTLPKTKIELEQKILKKDWKGACQLLKQFKQIDSSENYLMLRNNYVMTCYLDAGKLSTKLATFYMRIENPNKSLAELWLFDLQKTFLNQQIDSLLVGIRYSLDLIPSDSPYYKEILYRKLVFEGYREDDIVKLKQAIAINPDFRYVRLILDNLQRIREKSFEELKREYEEQRSRAYEERSLTKSASIEKRIALVIANANYVNERMLDNISINNANSLSTRLRKLGFNVTFVVNGNKNEIESALRRFSANSIYADVTLFFYSGHGFQAYGDNYLVPIDFRKDDSHVSIDNVVALNTVLEIMKYSKAKTNLVILDACNSMTSSSSNSTKTDSRFVQVSNLPQNTLVHYSAGPDEAPADRVFTTSLLDNLKKGIDINSLIEQVTKDVRERTNGKQSPQSVSTLREPFKF